MRYVCPESGTMVSCFTCKKPGMHIREELIPKGSTKIPTCERHKVELVLWRP